MGLLFAIPFALIAPATGQGDIGIGFAIALPFAYAIGAFIFVPIGCLVFNGVSKLVGGLEFEVTEGEANRA